MRADGGLARPYSQVQGRTYANMFALVERFIGAKVLDISRGHWLGDQVALEALVRLTDEELKHQELFRRLEAMMAPGGRAFDAAQQQAVHAAMLQAYRWQYIVSGVQDARFLEILGSMITAEQGARLNAALAPIVGAVH